MRMQWLVVAVWLAAACNKTGLSTTAGVDLGPDLATADALPDLAPPDLLGCTPQGPAASVDRWIAFDSNRVDFNRDLYAIRPDGCALRRLTQEPGNETEPAFAPDGRQLAFVSDRDGQTNQIFLLDLTTSAWTQVTHHAGGADEPAWSPDSKQLAFHSGADVYKIDVDGSHEALVIAGLDQYNAYEYPVFAPDGSIVADRGNQIDRIHADGTLTNIVPNTADTEDMPTLSPGGEELAFTTYCEVGIRSIWLSPITGLSRDGCSAGTRLTPVDGVDALRPAWGPASVIAYERGSGTTAIMLVGADGAAPFLLVGGADDRNPAWSTEHLMLTIGTPVP